MLEKLNDYKLLLGSQSPRRRQLMEGAGFKFQLLEPLEVDEIYPPHLKAQEIAIFLAELKANAYQNYITDDKTILITADTIVWLNEKVLGKPITRNDAIQMLNALSDNEHIVYTGVCIKMKEKNKSFFAETKVKFRALSQQEIEYYVDQYKPYDKAGSYGAQEWIGYIAIKEIQGSYFNVMGLPIQMLYTELEKLLTV
ncbi:MAG: septum formation protein Maf [Bacteroidales bacterium]|nr:septum formation protein Maf [Bacteroidales bacterium]